MASLTMDQFSISFIKSSEENLKKLFLYHVYKDCVKCPYITYRTLNSNNYTLTQSIHYPKLYRIMTQEVDTSPTDSKEYVHCDIEHTFGEYGKYEVIIDSNGCNTTTIEEPTNMYLPILYVFLMYAGISSALYFLVYAYKKQMKKSKNSTDVSNNVSKAPSKRVQSLDTFRGISIVLMIFVNYGCGGYAILDHAIWNGLQLADLVFPWFMWIMGVCIPISLSSIQKRGISKKAAIKNVFRRSCILFGLGLFLGASPYLDSLRIFGVLQRFGIAYFVVSTFCIVTMQSKPFTENEQNLLALKDIINTLKLWILAVILLVVHTLIIFFVTDSDCPQGYFGPGGYHENGIHFNCTGGATGYVDKVILGNHIYHNPTSKIIYHSQSFDPEGILGCFTSIIQVIIGFQAGVTLMTYKSHSARLIRWFCWALVTALIGGGLCGFSIEDGIIPINKNLWSISFVLVTSALAFCLLSICYILIDITNWWSGKPFIFAGMNATIMYVGHNMTYTNFPIHWYTSNQEPYNETHFLTLAENVWATGAWILVAYYLYRIKYFLSI